VATPSALGRRDGGGGGGARQFLITKYHQKLKRGPYSDVVFASTAAAGAPVPTETAVGKGVTEGWTPTALAVVECATGRAGDPETTTGGGLATAATEIGLEETPGNITELELTETAVVDVSLEVTATAVGTFEAASVSD